MNSKINITFGSTIKTKLQKRRAGEHNESIDKTYGKMSKFSWSGGHKDFPGVILRRTHFSFH